jgi:hypothetical protein
LFCIKCGYNQRGISTDRCPECGALRKDAPPSPVRIPWSHRRHVGVLRAYWRTVFLVIFRRRALCAEIEHPVSYSDARRFWALTLAQAYLPFLAATIAVFAAGRVSGWWKDGFLYTVLFTIVYAPIPPAIAINVGIFLFLAGATALPSYFCHPRQLPIEKQNRAIALSYYTAAPLAFMPMTMGLIIGTIAAEKISLIRTALAGAASLLGLLMLGAWYLHSVGLICALTGRRWLRVGFDLPGLSLFYVVFCVAASASLHYLAMLVFSFF